MEARIAALEKEVSALWRVLGIFAVVLGGLVAWALFGG